MKPLMLSLTILVTETTLIALHQDFDIKLKALSQIESNDNDKAKGRHGELSRYQLKRSVWKQHFPDEKDQRHIPSAAKKCAKAHLCWLELKLCLAQRTNNPDPKDIYAVWNLGLAGYAKHEYTFSKLPARLQDRAQRFTNIYHSLRNNQ